MSRWKKIIMCIRINDGTNKNIYLYYILKFLIFSVKRYFFLLFTVSDKIVTKKKVKEKESIEMLKILVLIE